MVLVIERKRLQDQQGLGIVLYLRTERGRLYKRTHRICVDTPCVEFVWKHMHRICVQTHTYNLCGSHTGYFCPSGSSHLLWFWWEKIGNTSYTKEHMLCWFLHMLNISFIFVVSCDFISYIFTSLLCDHKCVFQKCLCSGHNFVLFFNLQFLSTFLFSSNCVNIAMVGYLEFWVAALESDQ